MEKNKTNNSVVCIICGLLSGYGIVANIISLINGHGIIGIIKNIIDIVMVILIGYYAFSGYKKPHGNLLKAIILFFSATYLSAVFLHAKMGMPWQALILSIVIGLCCHIAGRLHKVKQNTILMIIVTVLIVANKVSGIVNVGVTIGALTSFIVWLDICAAYFLRYKEHKEAGLMDAEDNGGNEDGK